MLTPVEFMNRYHHLKVPIATEAHPYEVEVKLTKYRMNPDEGAEAMRGGTPGTENKDKWFQENRLSIYTAGVGKGAPRHYELALEWAVRSKKISNVSQHALQDYCNEHLGIDCAGFVTNYLVKCGKKPDLYKTLWNTGASTYYSDNLAKVINDDTLIVIGDLLVWMDVDSGKAKAEAPGHVALVESYRRVGGSPKDGVLRVVEACTIPTMPQLRESKYIVQDSNKINGQLGPVMILTIKRDDPRASEYDVAVIRF